MGGCHLNSARELDAAQFKYLHAGEERFSLLAPHLAAALTETTSSHQSNNPSLDSQQLCFYSDTFTSLIPMASLLFFSFSNLLRFCFEENLVIKCLKAICSLEYTFIDTFSPLKKVNSL